MTSKPISTISYNTLGFLTEKLTEWYEAHIIQAFQIISHKGEDGDKDHHHVRLEPNKRVDPMTLLEDLREYVPTHEKPLGCRPFRPSKEEDWFLYAVHDPEYLKIKYGGGEKGEKLPYDWRDIVVSPYYDLETAFIRAKATLLHTSSGLAQRIMDGDAPLSLALEGENVHTVNTLNNLLYKTDYQRVASQLSFLKSEYDNLFHAIEISGFYVEYDEDGFPVLKPQKGFHIVPF